MICRLLSNFEPEGQIQLCSWEEYTRQQTGDIQQAAAKHMAKAKTQAPTDPREERAAVSILHFVLGSLLSWFTRWSTDFTQGSSHCQVWGMLAGF